VPPISNKPCQFANVSPTAFMDTKGVNILNIDENFKFINANTIKQVDGSGTKFHILQQWNKNGFIKFIEIV